MFKLDGVNNDELVIYVVYQTKNSCINLYVQVVTFLYVVLQLQCVMYVSVYARYETPYYYVYSCLQSKYCSKIAAGVQSDVQFVVKTGKLKMNPYSKQNSCSSSDLRAIFIKRSKILKARSDGCRHKINVHLLSLFFFYKLSLPGQVQHEYKCFVVIRCVHILVWGLRLRILPQNLNCQQNYGWSQRNITVNTSSLKKKQSLF